MHKTTQKKQSAYISKPFEFEIPLSNRTFFEPKKHTLNSFTIDEFVTKKLYHLTWEKVKNTIDSKASIADQILQLFKHDEICLGPKNNIDNHRAEFVKRINYFVKNDKPILLDATQVAFKIPNPIKTNRTTPDIGELAFLSQVKDLIGLIEKIYKPGAEFIIFGESYVFNHVVGISREEGDIYFKIMKKWIKALKMDKQVHLYDLRELEQKHPLMTKKYKSHLKQLAEEWNAQKGVFYEEINGVIPTLFYSMNTRFFTKEQLMDIYDLKKTDKHLIAIREMIRNQVIENIMHYIAYHKSVGTSKLADALFPHSLPTSFTSFDGKISIQVLGPHNSLYSYHGPGLLAKDGKVTVVYEIDLLRRKGVHAYYLKGETTPFYYTLGE